MGIERGWLLRERGAPWDDAPWRHDAGACLWAELIRRLMMVLRSCRFVQLISALQLTDGAALGGRWEPECLNTVCE